MAPWPCPRPGRRPVVTGGIASARADTAACTQITARTAYWYFAAGLLTGAELVADLSPVQSRASGFAGSAVLKPAFVMC